MFHSTKLIAEAPLPPSDAEPAMALPPKARRPRRTPALAIGGLAVIATLGVGWMVMRPACACTLPPIHPRTASTNQPSTVVTHGNATQVVPAASALMHRSGLRNPMMLRPVAVQPVSLTIK
ncbi:MAG TPA: hypothetical protein VGG12_05595 [Methylovirgula sp.]|jgi:hypothetical protein